MRHGFPGGEADPVDVCVLVDGCGARASVMGDDELFSGFVRRGLGEPVGVAGREIFLIWRDPDLQQSDGGRVGGVELAVKDP